MKYFWLLAVAASLGIAERLEAGTLYDYSYSSISVSGSGTVLLEDNGLGDGSFTAASGSGTDSLYGAITLLPNPNAPNASSSPVAGITYDNQVFPGSDPALNNNGLLFVNNQGVEINLYSTGPGAYNYLDSNNNSFDISFTLTPSLVAAPEPASLLLLCVGAVAIGGYRRVSRV